MFTFPKAKPNTPRRLDLPKVVAHGGWKIEVRTMGWYASTAAGEDLGEAGWMSPFFQINNPYNKNCFSFHLCITTCPHGKDELNLEKLI